MTERDRTPARLSRQSVFFYWDSVPRDACLRRPPDYHRQMYPHMLIEDVQYSIMPIGGRVHKGHFAVSLIPHEPAVEAVIIAALCSEHRGRSLAEATCDFVAECAYLVMAFGEAFYEIAWFVAPEGSVNAFRLALVPPCTARRRWGKLIQQLPKAVATERSVERLVRLPQEDILHFVHPFHRPGELRRVMRSLSALSILPDPSFAMQPLQSEHDRVPYDLDRHVGAWKVAVAAITKSIGWDARDRAPEGVLGYYTMQRRLRFERFKIQLRDAIMATLNRGLQRAGMRLGFTATLQLEGLPTLADVDTAESRLQTGAAPFGEILEPFNRY